MGTKVIATAKINKHPKANTFQLNIPADITKHAYLVQRIRYKSEEYGIKVTAVDESHTSSFCPGSYTLVVDRSGWGNNREKGKWRVKVTEAERKVSRIIITWGKKTPKDYA